MYTQIEAPVLDFVTQVEKTLAPLYQNIETVAEINQLKVLQAMQKNRLTDTHFNESTGYGYNDEGREAMEAIFADTFKTEAVLVRPQIVSGTHALATALFGNLRPGDTLLSPVGSPYDTLESVIGIRPTSGSLAEYGVKYAQVDLLPGGTIDYPAVKKALEAKPKMATIQRSKGYDWRNSFTVAEIETLIACIRNLSPDTIIMVDNCYGEFCEITEPSMGDLMVGSLIKNPGGGIALGGGYVAGGAKYVEAAAERLTAPGVGSAVGPSLGLTRNILQGFFMAPQTVSAAIKGATLAAAVFEKLGFEISPKVDSTRTDIVQAIKLGSPENTLAFCRGIQMAAPVDSFVLPEYGDMPGYESSVVMAGGTFIQGSSIELSADAPMREPFIVYLQGGLTPAHTKIGVLYAVNELYKIGAVKI